MTTALILGAAVWPEGASPALRRRTGHGARLYHQGRVQTLVVCGGLGKYPPTEAEAMARILREEGVPDCAVTLEDRSTTTGENIRYALPLLAEPDVLIVTDWYHVPRAILIARRHGLRARGSSPTLKGARFWQQAKLVLRETFAMMAYILRIKR